MQEAKDIKSRLIRSGSLLFAEKGFKGVSVREVCKHAGASQSMIHHYFKSKQGLLDAILKHYSEDVYLIPSRIIEPELTTKDDFIARIRLIFITTFEACLAHRNVVVLVWRERITPVPLISYLNRLKVFITGAIEKGYVRSSVEPDMITGFMFDRIMNQVQLAPWLKENFGTDLEADKAYRDRWSAANIDIFLSGLVNNN